MTRIWKESSTFRRLWHSQHLADLRAILAAVFLGAVLSLILFGFLPGDESAADKIRQVLTVLAGAGAIVAWVYRSASKRLGVVDLFACEIVTLCRVCTVVDAAHRLIEGFKSLAVAQPTGTEPGKPRTEFGRFTSQENYFPVFQQNASDLQILEADVVTNVTAFYTYMKAMRDYMRQLGELSEAQGEAVIERKRGILLNAIYMLFLAFESARRSVHDLVEFQPTQAEDTITILMTELPAYGFLLGHHFADVAHKPRLALREETYRQEVPSLLRKVASDPGPDWKRAQSLVSELTRRYEEVFPSAAGRSGRGSSPIHPAVADDRHERHAA